MLRILTYQIVIQILLSY